MPGCASRPADRSGLFEPYRTDLPQGNYLTQEMIDQVRSGMTREQVKFALGSPLLTPVFRTDRWDYVFRYQRANGTSELRRVVVRFGDDKVVSVQAADTLPANAESDDPALPGYRAPAHAEPNK
ncbi:MAG: outer membrane protein assembly factor BamE [Burkholderiaceae bacterium]|nr:outer membrane protein assembly factor BamE [Burkholderiaceae bacterium]